VLIQEFNLWFGVENDLNAWYFLCRALRITSPFTICELCRLIGPQTFLLFTCINAQLRPFAAAILILSILLNKAETAVNTFKYFSPLKN